MYSKGWWHSDAEAFQTLVLAQLVTNMADKKEVSLKWLNVPCLSHRPNLALKVCNVTTQAQTLQRGKLIVLSSLWLWLCLREAPFYTQVFSARLLGLYTVGNSDLLKQNFVCLQLIDKGQETEFWFKPWTEFIFNIQPRLLMNRFEVCQWLRNVSKPNGCRVSVCSNARLKFFLTATLEFLCLDIVTSKRMALEKRIPTDTRRFCSNKVLMQL